MISRTERYLASAADCELAAESAAVRAVRAMYLDLALRGDNWPTRLKRWTESAVIALPGASEIEAPPRDSAGIISWQTSSANIRPYGVGSRAPSRYLRPPQAQHSDYR
ncbi:MAG: hypothetical protein WBD59_21100, partial [Candidatus Sulfotelmatobacter sp.]